MLKRNNNDYETVCTFDMNTALKKKIYIYTHIHILLESSNLVSSKQYRPRTTDNDFTIRIFRHFLTDRKQSNFAQKSFNK